MRQIGNGLCDLLKTIEADLIEHKCKQDRHDGSKCNSQHTQTNRIDHGLTEQPVCECLFKIVKPHKLSLPYRKCKAVWLYLLKRHCPSPQRNIFKNDEPDDKRYRHQQQIPLLPHKLPAEFLFGHFGFLFLFCLHIIFLLFSSSL